MTKKILVADDEIPILELIAERLRESQYQVVTASDGLLAVQLAHDEKPDLIILDLKMPAGGGMGAFDNLKRSGRTSMIPIIFITAYVNEDVKKKVQEKGVKNFLIKPFDLDTLLKKVKDILGE